MKNAKRTLSKVMVGVFTTFILLSGIPTSAAPKKATAAAAKAKVVAAQKAAAAKKAAEAKKIAALKKAQAAAIAKANAKVVAAQKAAKAAKDLAAKLAADQKAKDEAAAKAAADAAAAKAVVDQAVAAVVNAEARTNTDTYDLVGNADDLSAAQEAVTSALEAVVKLDKDSSDYLGLMARIDAANAAIETANQDIEKAKEDADAAAAEVAAEKTAETAVAAVEAAPLATADDLTAALALGKTAQDAVAAVTDTTKAADFTARLKVVADKGLDLKAQLDQAAADAAAAALEAATPASLVSVSAVDGTITVTFNKKPLKNVAASDFTVTESINNAAAVNVTPSVINVTSDTAVALTVPAIAQAKADQNVVYNVTYTTGSAVSAIAYVVPAIPPVKINTVDSISNKTISLTLSKDYDSTTDTFTVYNTLDASSTVAVTAVADSISPANNKVVLVGNFVTGTNYTVKLTRGTEISTSAFAVPTDTTVPQLSSVEVVGNQILKLHFSEPVNNLAALNAGASNYGYRLVGATSWTNITNAVAAFSASADLKTVTITFNAANALPTGSYELTAQQDGTTDLADFSDGAYRVPVVPKSFSVSTATSVASVASVTVNNRTSVTVNFTAPVLAPVAANVYWNTDGLVGSNTNIATTVTKVNDSSYTFAFTTNIIPVNSVTFFVKNVVDAYGNAVPTYNVAKTVAQDAVATATVAAASDNSIVVTFSKSMQGTNGMVNTVTTGDAANRAYYTVTDASGVAQTITSATYNDDGTTFTTTLAMSNHLNGAYKVSVSNAVLDKLGQAFTGLASAGLTIADTTKPAVGSVSVSAVNGTRTLVINFPEAMATSGAYSILDPNNYEYAADGSTYAGLKAGASITASADAKTATIVLAGTETAINTAASKIGVGRVAASTIYTVADATGNILDTLPGVAATRKAIVADGAPTIGAATGVAVVDATHIKVAVSTATLASAVASDYVYSLDNSAPTVVASGAALSTVNGVQYVTLTLSGTDVINASTNKNLIRVGTIAGACASKTALGTSLASSQATNATNAANTTTFAASIKNIDIVDANTINVYLDGKLPAGAGNANRTAFANSLVIYQNGTKVTTTIAAALKDGTTPNSVVVLTLGTAIDTSAPVTIKTVSSDFMTVVDFNNKAFTPNTTGITGSSALIATAAANTFTGAGLAIADNSVITFNRALDTTSINSAWDGSAPATVLARISTAGNLTIDNYAIGTLSGFTNGTGSEVTVAATLAYNSIAKTLTLTFTGAPSGAVTLGGTVTYTPGAAMKSASGIAIGTSFTPVN